MNDAAEDKPGAGAEPMIDSPVHGGIAVGRTVGSNPATGANSTGEEMGSLRSDIISVLDRYKYDGFPVERCADLIMRAMTSHRGDETALVKALRDQAARETKSADNPFAARKERVEWQAADFIESAIDPRTSAVTEGDSA